MSPLILFAANLSLAGGALGSLQQSSAICQARPEYAEFGCSVALPFLRYGETEPHSLDPSLQVLDVDGNVLFDTWEDAEALTYNPAHGTLPTPFWFGDPLNCEEWSNTASCAQGVVAGEEYVRSLAPCDALHRFYCVCVGAMAWRLRWR